MRESPKVLIANRGEIAVRVIRACREMGFRTAAVYSECDRGALHVRLADEAYPIGPSPAVESYLRIDTLVDVARSSGATLVHPGYGFLAENADFAQVCTDAGLTFIGPPADAIRRMGSKTLAREAAIAAGVPVVPGTRVPFTASATDGEIAAAAAEVGYPLLVKAVAGGGGKGMRVVIDPADLAGATRLARSEAASAFGDAGIYLERRLADPRHIEIQLMADAHGTVVPFVERECSIQRRHQKLVEESPSQALPSTTRREMAAAAQRIAASVGYVNAGTIEFLLDASGAFYFLEMNTRLQVEHPVTEAVTGLDLVRWQLRIAMGERLTISAEEALTPRGHAIECRIYAEDPDRGFLPSPGRVRALEVPGGPGIRDDGGIAAGDEISLFYDALLAKLIAWAPTRDAAIERLSRALQEYRVVGVRTTLPFFRWLVREPAFLEGRFSTSYLDAVLAVRQGAPFETAPAHDVDIAAIAVAVTAWLRAQNGAAASDAEDQSAMATWRQAARLEGRR